MEVQILSSRHRLGSLSVKYFNKTYFNMYSETFTAISSDSRSPKFEMLEHQ